jgi:hypothetical protein
MRIEEKADIRRLCIGVINQAVKDYLFGDPIEQVLALEFLVSPDLFIFADAASLDVDVRRILNNPEAAKQVILQKYKLKKGKRQHDRTIQLRRGQFGRRRKRNDSTAGDGVPQEATDTREGTGISERGRGEPVEGGL